MGSNDTSDNGVNPTTELVGTQTRDDKGRITGGKPPVGFHTNPENISPGGWKKENTISYQYNRFLNMTPEQLQEWAKTPNNERTVAMDLAYNRVLEARKSLPDMKEITDRTEGRASQSVDITSGGEILGRELSNEDLEKRISEHLERRSGTSTTNS